MELSEAYTGKLIIVDDESVHYRLYKMIFEDLGFETANIETYETADTAVARISELQEQDALITAIFSDGLEGEWKKVIEAAKTARVPAAVISGDLYHKENVEATGTLFVQKPLVHPSEVFLHIVQSLPSRQNGHDGGL